MIKTVTRFNPSLTGPLHIGHAYICYVNETEAHLTDGTFIVRFDDLQRFWKYYMGGEGALRKCADGMKEDLDWLGVKVDQYLFESEIAEQVERIISEELFDKVLPIPFTYPLGPSVIGEIEQYYPFTPDLTSRKVVMDICMGFVNHLIRGIDLISEYGLYQYFCHQYKIAPPKHTYIPRLSFPGQQISKTIGNMKISEFREAGYTPEQLKRGLAVSCLIDPDAGWFVSNIKNQPMWMGIGSNPTEESIARINP